MKNTDKGITFLGLLTITFIVLKLLGIINWGWFWIMFPLLLPTAIILILILIVFLEAFIKELLNQLKK